MNEQCLYFMKKTYLLASWTIAVISSFGLPDRMPAAEAEPFPVTIRVDVTKPIGPLRQIWRFFGADDQLHGLQRHVGVRPDEQARVDSCL